MVRAHFTVCAGICGVCITSSEYVLYSMDWQRVPFAAWVDMALHGALWRALKTSDKKPEHVCIWCWGILEWHSLTIYACIHCTHTLNWSSILWTCNFAYIAARCYVVMAWLWPSHWTVLSSIIRRSGMTSAIDTRFLKMMSDLCCRLVASMIIR